MFFHSTTLWEIAKVKLSLNTGVLGRARSDDVQKTESNLSYGEAPGQVRLQRPGRFVLGGFTAQNLDAEWLVGVGPAQINLLWFISGRYP